MPPSIVGQPPQGAFATQSNDEAARRSGVDKRLLQTSSKGAIS